MEISTLAEDLNISIRAKYRTLQLQYIEQFWTSHFSFCGKHMFKRQVQIATHAQY